MLGALLFEEEEEEEREEEIKGELLMIRRSEWFRVFSIQSGHVIFSDVVQVCQYSAAYSVPWSPLHSSVNSFTISFTLLLLTRSLRIC